MAEDIGAQLLARQQQAAQGGKQGWWDGAMNKGAQTLNAQALGFDKPIFGGAGILGIFFNGGAFSSKNPGLKKIGQGICSDASQASSRSMQELAQNVAAVGQALASNGVQQSSAEQIRGHGLAALGPSNGQYLS